MSDISKQLIEQVNAAHASKTPIRIQGGGTKTHFGRQTDESITMVSTKEHSGITDYTPVELIMTARAGTSLAEIDAELEKNNQMLACDPRRFAGNATIGGSLAANQSGAARPWLGSLRDHVLGVKLINGQGEQLQFGGQVMKNVAGYDVSRLQAGAMGTLGVMTELSFKVLPKPMHSATVLKETDAVTAITLMNQLSITSKPITGVSWNAGQLRVRLEGEATAVEATIQQWNTHYDLQQEDEEAAKRYWFELREQALPFFANPSEPLWRFSVNAAAKMQLPDEKWLFNWSGSERWLRGDFEFKELHDIAKAMKGEVQLYSGGDRSGEVSVISNDMLKTLTRNVKHSLDPENIFNPGRLYGWL